VSPSLNPRRSLRARDEDRNAAQDALAAAYADGQLSREEYDRRSTAALTAVSVADLAGLTSDLQDDPDKATQLVHLPSARRVLPVIFVAALLVAGYVGVSTLMNNDGARNVFTSNSTGSGASDPGSASDPPLLLPGEQHLLTDDGFTNLVAAMRDKFGTAKVAGAVIYPGYASLSVPHREDPHKLFNYYFDGFFDDPTAGGTRDVKTPLVDLGKVDAVAMARLVRQAPQALGLMRPETEYLIFDLGGSSHKPHMSVYVSDGYDSGYIVATLAGEVVDSYAPN
jgi:hypothetical protein